MMVGVDRDDRGARRCALEAQQRVSRQLPLPRASETPGHFVLESVLVVSAGITLAAFAVWFLFFAGASPVPVGIQI